VRKYKEFSRLVKVNKHETKIHILKFLKWASVHGKVTPVGDVLEFKMKHKLFKKYILKVVSVTAE